MKTLTSSMIHTFALAMVLFMHPELLLGANTDQLTDSAGAMREVAETTVVGVAADRSGGMTAAAAAFGPEEPLAQSHCNASLDCGDQVISCTGHNSCTSSRVEGTVTCDGQVTTCPNRCEVSIDCCPSFGCTLHCYSNSGNCVVGSDYIQCDTSVVRCVDWCGC